MFWGLELYKSLTAITTADLFHRKGERTPVFAQFLRLHMALATYFKSTTYAPMRAGFERAIWLLELRLNHSLICEPGQFLGQAILWMLHYMTRNN